MGTGVGTGVDTGVGAGVDEAGGTMVCAFVCSFGGSVDFADCLGGSVERTVWESFSETVRLFSAGFEVDFGLSVGVAGTLLETIAFLLSEEEAGFST